MKRSRSRAAKWNLFFHYVSIGLVLVSGTVLIPLYLQYIPLGTYGAWLATGNILAWLTVIDPGLSTVLQQRASAAYGKRDVVELGALLTGGVLLSGIVALLVLVVGLVSSHFLIAWLNLSTTPDIDIVEQAFVLAAIGSALMIFSYGLTAFNQGLQSSLGIGLVFVITMIGSLVLTVFLLYQGVGLLALPFGLIVRGAGFTVGNAGYLLWRTWGEKFQFRVSLRGVGTLAKLTSYTFLGRGAGVIASNMDAFVLTRYLGPEVAPIFVLTRKAPDMSRMFVERPAVAFMPAVAHLAGSGDLDRARAVLLRLVRLTLWLLGLIAAGVLVFNRDFVALWVGADLFAGPFVNVVIVLALVVYVLVNGLSSLCFALGNIKGNSLASVAQGLLSVPLIIVGAKYWGMNGAALAPLVAMLATTAWYYPRIFSRLLELERADISAIAREAVNVLAAATIVIAAFVWVTLTTWVAFILTTMTFAILYALILGLLSQPFRDEMLGFLRYARSRGSRAMPRPG